MHRIGSRSSDHSLRSCAYCSIEQMWFLDYLWPIEADTRWMVRFGRSPTDKTVWNYVRFRYSDQVVDDGCAKNEKWINKKQTKNTKLITIVKSKSKTIKPWKHKESHIIIWMQSCMHELPLIDRAWTSFFEACHLNDVEEHGAQCVGSFCKEIHKNMG